MEKFAPQWSGVELLILENGDGNPAGVKSSKRAVPGRAGPGGIIEAPVTLLSINDSVNANNTTPAMFSSVLIEDNEVVQ